jgi:5'-nucleotidase
LTRPLILVTNDDGVASIGLALAVEALEPLGEVMVCAPDGERSGTSHSITFHTHLRVHEVRPSWWQVSGTPVDCVYLALHHMCPRPPALVVSGVNAGYNMGSDVFYSGTVGAAAEAYLRGVSGLAVSTARDADPRITVPIVRTIAAALLAAERRHLLNLNVPPAPEGEASQPRRVEVTRLGQRSYKDAVAHRTDPFGRPYFWIGGAPLQSSDREGEDTWAIGRGHVSVTPLEMDITAPDAAPCRALLGAMLGRDLAGEDR